MWDESKGWFYNVENNRKVLKQIEQRYFRPVGGTTSKEPIPKLVHHGDCDIYQSKEVYSMSPCTCGLLHDLIPIADSICKKLYPNYLDDEYRSRSTWDEEQEQKKTLNDERFQKLAEVVREVFGEPDKPSLQEMEIIDGQDWELIEEAFGKEYTEELKADERKRNSGTSV